MSSQDALQPLLRGPDGKTVYVTEVEHTRLVQFRVEKRASRAEMAKEIADIG